MANQVTLFTHAGDWKADVKAWKTNYLFYKSIWFRSDGVPPRADEDIWGNTVTDWVKKPATLIEITNVYHGSGPGAATRQKACENASYCELKEWAYGVTITVETIRGTRVRAAGRF